MHRHHAVAPTFVADRSPDVRLRVPGRDPGSHGDRDLGIRPVVARGLAQDLGHRGQCHLDRRLEALPGQFPLPAFAGSAEDAEVRRATGKAHYTQQRIEGLGNIYASLVGANGRVYILDRDGKAVVFKHGETFELLAENKLDDAFDASPVIVGDTILLRGHEHLYSIAAP